MDIAEFFQLSVGKWFSYRTNQNLETSQSQVGKSDLQIEALPGTDSEVVKLCQLHHIDPSQANFATQITWSGTLDSKPEKQTGKTILVSVADPDKPNQGKILSKLGNAESVCGSYLLGDDDVLTLVTENGSSFLEERIWFASPNLRLRTSILKQAGGFNAVSFCSEIRMGVTKPA